MESNRTKAFAALFVIAILGGVFAYRKESKTMVSNPVTNRPSGPVQSVPDNQVKGITVTKTAQDPKSIASQIYTDANSASHMNLTVQNIIWFTNYERVKNNLAPLVESSELDYSSQLKNQDMVTYQYFDHTRPATTVTFDHFFDVANYVFIKAGENLAEGDFSSTKQLMDDWMNSPEHRRNILDPTYTQIGVGVQYANFKGFWSTLVVQHFGEPRANCPSVDGTTASTMKGLQVQVDQLNTNIAAVQKSMAGTDQSTDAYDQLVNDYNNLANNYNQAIAEIQTLAQKYNAQVAAFNKCIAR